jgi:hypothetical protein
MNPLKRDSRWPVATITVRVDYTLTDGVTAGGISGTASYRTVTIGSDFDTFTRVPVGGSPRTACGALPETPLTFTLIEPAFDGHSPRGPNCRCCPCSAQMSALVRTVPEEGTDPPLPTVGVYQEYDSDDLLVLAKNVYGRISSLYITTPRCASGELGGYAFLYSDFVDAPDPDVDAALGKDPNGTVELNDEQVLTLAGSATFFIGSATFTVPLPNGYTVTFGLKRGSETNYDYETSMLYDASLPANDGLAPPPLNLLDGILLAIKGDGMRVCFTGQYGLQPVTLGTVLSNDFEGKEWNEAGITGSVQFAGFETYMLNDAGNYYQVPWSASTGIINTDPCPDNLSGTNDVDAFGNSITVTWS